MIEWKDRKLGVNPILLQDPRSYTSPTGDLATHEHFGKVSTGGKQSYTPRCQGQTWSFGGKEAVVFWTCLGKIKYKASHGGTERMKTGPRTI